MIDIVFVFDYSVYPCRFPPFLFLMLLKKTFFVDQIHQVFSPDMPLLALVPYFLCFCFHAFVPLVFCMFLLRNTLICYPLRSFCFHRFHCYYEIVRLLLDHRLLSVYKTSICLTVTQSLTDLPGMHILLCMLAAPSDPDESSSDSLNVSAASVCCYEESIDSHFCNLRG